MFKLTIHGQVREAEPDHLIVAVPHDGAGWTDPVIVVCHKDRPAVLSAAAAFGRGDRVWCAGRGYVQHDGDRPHLHLAMDAIAEPAPGLIAGRGHLHAVVHGTISEADQYLGRRRDGVPFWRFALRVQVPELPAGQQVPLRVKLSGPAVDWVRSRHAVGDRINLEGTLQESRWSDPDGVQRHAYELKVRGERWWFAKPSDPQRRRVRRIVSERVTSRPHQRASEVTDDGD